MCAREREGEEAEEKMDFLGTHTYTQRRLKGGREGGKEGSKSGPKEGTTIRRRKVKARKEGRWGNEELGR